MAQHHDGSPATASEASSAFAITAPPTAGAQTGPVSASAANDANLAGPTERSVAFTDVVEALVAPLAPTMVHAARAGLHLRAVDPSDLALPTHHDTAIDDDNVRHLVSSGDIVLMDDFAGELRRWLTSQSR